MLHILLIFYILQTCSLFLPGFPHFSYNWQPIPSWQIIWFILSSHPPCLHSTRILAACMSAYKILHFPSSLELKCCFVVRFWPIGYVTLSCGILLSPPKVTVAMYSLSLYFIIASFLLSGMRWLRVTLGSDIRA